jgi:hypothetical protein
VKENQLYYANSGLSENSINGAIV